MKTSIFLSLYLFRGALSQYCIAGPQYPEDTNIVGVQLVADNVVQYNPPCPGILRVDDQTQTSPMLYITQGVSYGASSVSFGACGSYYSHAWTVWVDFNRNSLFDSAEAINDGTGAPTSPVPFTIPATLPPDTVGGPSRLRIMLREGGTRPLSPCANFSWGSVIDFAVMIVQTESPTAAPTPGFSVPDSFAEGPGLVDSPLNRLAVFTIYAMLDDNTHMTVGGKMWTSNLYGLDTRAVGVVNITDYNDGSYGARYMLTVADTYTLYISTGTQQVKNSPLIIRGALSTVTESAEKRIEKTQMNSEDVDLTQNLINEDVDENGESVLAQTLKTLNSKDATEDATDESAEIPAIVAELN